MTKQDILRMTNSHEIINTMLKNPHLIDDEISEYQKKVSKREHIDEYGDSEIHIDPLKKKQAS